MDVLTLLVGAGLAIVPASVAWLLGRASGRAQSRQVAAPALVCSCGHGYGMHEDERRCHGVDDRWRNGVKVLDPCPCRRYDGPEPLPRAEERAEELGPTARYGRSSSAPSWTPPVLPG